jgi:hypothetical protein
MNPAAQTILLILAWGTLATLAMTSILLVAQNMGWSRLNLPFLLGAFFTGRRREANVLGLMLYVLGGWLFAFVYFLLLSLVGMATWWMGAVAGFVHALLLLALALPMLPYMHPRMASEYDGPDLQRTLEPPGFLGLHYGYRTPLVTLAAQTAYGAILGVGFSGLLR